MTDETDNKNSAEKPNEICLKIPSCFYSPSYLQPQESSPEHSLQSMYGNLLCVFPPFLRNLLQNRQTLWVILQTFWQKTNLKI